MDKALGYLALARKGGRVELGEEPVNAVTRANRAALVLVARDASEHTWRRAKSFVAGTQQPCLRLPYSKDEMGQAVGRMALSIAAVTDPALALALVRAMPQPDSEILQALESRTNRLRQRQKEAQASVRNRRFGVKKEH